MGAGVSQSGALAPAGTSIGVGGDSGSEHSVTSAGISGVAGDKTVRTGDAPTGVAKIFDAARVEQDVGAQVFIMQTFTREAPRAIARYADTQVQDLLKQAGSETDLDKQALLRSFGTLIKLLAFRLICPLIGNLRYPELGDTHQVLAPSANLSAIR